MRHKKLLFGLAIASLLISTVACASLLIYRFRTSYKIKAFISPTVKTVDLGDLYADADGETYSFNGTWGQYKTWATNTSITFNASLTNAMTLSTDFTAFSITLTFGVEGSMTVDLANTTDTITLNGEGSVTYNISCTTLADGGCEVTRTNLAIVEVSVTHP